MNKDELKNVMNLGFKKVSEVAQYMRYIKKLKG